VLASVTAVAIHDDRDVFWDVAAVKNAKKKAFVSHGNFVDRPTHDLDDFHRRAIFRWGDPHF
jgi:hypothetical protein